MCQTFGFGFKLDLDLFFSFASDILPGFCQNLSLLEQTPIALNIIDFKNCDTHAHTHTHIQIYTQSTHTHSPTQTSKQAKEHTKSFYPLLIFT